MVHVSILEGLKCTKISYESPYAALFFMSAPENTIDKFFLLTNSQDGDFNILRKNFLLTSRLSYCINKRELQIFGKRLYMSTG